MSQGENAVTSALLFIMNRFYISLLALATALPALAQESGDEGRKLKLVGSVQSDILIPQEDKKIGTGSYKEWARNAVHIHRLNETGKRIKQLEQELAELKNDK